MATTKSVSTLSSTARSAIVATFCSALDSVENSGSMVTQVCNMADKYLGGEIMSKEDQDGVIAGVAKARNWKGDSIKVRSSEARTVLKTYSTLPEAIKLYRAKESVCNWHTALRLARALLKHKGNVAQAVAYVRDNAGGSAKAVNPAGRTAGALKAWYAASRGDKRKVIEKAAQLLATIGLKLDLQ